MNGLAGYIGTDAETAAMLVTVVLLVVIVAMLVYYVKMDPFLTFFTMMLLIGMFTVLGWFWAWIALFIFFTSLAYVVFIGARSMSGGIGQ